MSAGSAGGKEAPILNILLIEDSPSDALLIQEYLAQAREPRFVVEHHTRLSAGLTRLGAGGIDALILDLSLPDSEGVQTVLQARGQAPEVPTVVLTGIDDEAVAIQAVQEGAQDYLVKSRIDTGAMVRSIRYAIQRHRIQQSLHKARRELDTRGVAAAEQKPSRITPLSWITKTLGPKRLTDIEAQNMVRRLSNALSVAGEADSWNIDAKISAGLRSVAKDLARLRAGPRDVLELCSACLKRDSVPGSPAPDEQCSRLALELMGHLVSHYLESI